MKNCLSLIRNDSKAKESISSNHHKQYNSPKFSTVQYQHQLHQQSTAVSHGALTIVVEDNEDEVKESYKD